MTPAERENIQIFGSDVSFRMVDFATRNAERAGVADVVQFRGGDALQRMPPCENEKKNGIMIVNPPYGDRIGISGVAGQNARRSGGRENAQQNGQQNQRQNPNQNANYNPDAGDFEQDGPSDQPRFGQRETAQTENVDRIRVFPAIVSALEEKLRRLDRPCADARHEAPHQNAPQRIPPRPHVERPN